MRSLAVLPKTVTENDSVYQTGYTNYNGLDNLLVDNGEPNEDQFTPGDTQNFAYTSADYGSSDPPVIKVNDVRIWSGTAFGNNLLSSAVTLASLGTNNVISVTLPEPITVAQLRAGGIGFALHSDFTSTGQKDSMQKSHILLQGAVQNDLPNDAEVSQIFIKIAYALKNTFTPPNYYDIASLYSVYVELEYEEGGDPGSSEFRLIGKNEDAGFLDVFGYQFKTDNVRKRYQYMVYDRGVFLGELGDVISLPSLRLALNSFPSEVKVEVAKDAGADLQQIEGLYIVDDGEPEPAIDNERVEVNVAGETVSAFGEGTMINVNNDVDIYEYNGHYEDIVLDDGEPLVLSDMERLSTPIGSPEGKMFFSGYISKYDVSYKKSSKGVVELTFLSHADEYNNIILSSEPSAFAENSDQNDNVYLTMGAKPSSSDGYADIYSVIAYTPTERTVLSSVQLYCSRNGTDYATPSSYPQMSVFITDTLADPRGTLDIIALSSARIQMNKPYWQSFGFDNGVELQANHTYYIWARCDTFGLAWTMKLYSANSEIGNGGYYRYSTANFDKGTGTYVNTGTRAMQVKLMNTGGETLIPMYSKDPSDMAKTVIDYGLSLGSRIGYTPSSITESGTLISAKFNMNTLKEALDAIINYEPTDWYWYLDQTDLNIYLNPKSESVTHWLTLHKDIQELTLEHSMEDLVNEVYFTGGKATYEVPTPNENKTYQGGSASSTIVCSPIFKPEADVPYKVYADVENKSTFVKVYKYYGSSTPRETAVAEAKNGELVFSYSSTNDSDLTGICLACRADGNPTLSPSSVVFSLASEKNIYRHLINSDSQTRYRRSLVKKTDQRVTNNQSADIIAEGEIARNNEPIFAGTVKVLRDEHLDMINPGSLVGFRNFGNYIDNLRLLVMEVVIERDTLTLSLGAFVPKTSKRLEDIKRNLTVLENEMNPSSPTGGTNV